MAKDKQWEAIKLKEKELKPLKERQKRHLNLYLQKKYELMYTTGDNISKPIPGAENTTSSILTAFADRVMAQLVLADILYRSVGNLLADADHTKIEHLVSRMKDHAEWNFMESTMLQVHATNVFQTCLRGWVGMFNWMYTDEEGRLVVDQRPLDIPKMTWQEGTRGYDWVNTTTMRDSHLVERDYGYKAKGAKCRVDDLWRPDGNLIYLDEKYHGGRDNPMNQVPIVLLPISKTPLVAGDEEVANISMLGPSIFTGAENDYEVINKIDTILMTLFFCGFRPPLQSKTEEGNKAPSSYPYEHGTFIKMFQKDELVKVPMGEVMQEGAYLYGVRDAAFQRMTVPYNDFGGLGFELSALALEKLQKERAQLFGPLIAVLEALYTRSYSMLFNQWMTMDVGVLTSCGVDADDYEFQQKDFKNYEGKFALRCDMATESPEGDIAKLSKGAAAQSLGYSKEGILKDVIKHPEPEQELMRRNNEEVELLVPTLKLKRSVDSLIKKAEMAKTTEERDGILMEAMLVEEEMDRLMGEQQAPPQPTMGAGVPAAGGAGSQQSGHILPLTVPPGQERQPPPKSIPPTQRRELQREGVEVNE